jgi:hypothetical protein
VTPDPPGTLPLHLLDQIPFTAVYQVALERSGRIWFPYISDGIEDILGITPAEVYQSDTLLHDLIHEADIPVFLSAWKTSVHDLMPFQVVVRQHHRQNGLRCSLLRSRPTRDPSGRITWNGLQVDLTHQIPPTELERVPTRAMDLLPVCAWCSRYRSVDGTWRHPGGLLSLFDRNRVTHGICPACSQVFG